MDKQRKVVLSFSDGSRESIEFPIMSGAMGPEVIDISTLHAKSGMFTYDTG